MCPRGIHDNAIGPRWIHDAYINGTAMGLQWIYVGSIHGLAVGNDESIRGTAMGS